MWVREKERELVADVRFSNCTEKVPKNCKDIQHPTVRDEDAGFECITSKSCSSTSFNSIM